MEPGQRVPLKKKAEFHPIELSPRHPDKDGVGVRQRQTHPWPPVLDKFSFDIHSSN
jgi:hypothetical protein